MQFIVSELNDRNNFDGDLERFVREHIDFEHVGREYPRVASMDVLGFWGRIRPGG